MTRTEFTERVGFEPTAAEYEEIEAEYMGTDVDKDQFCKEWKKNGGIQRLMRLRARRIEELENELRRKDEMLAARIEADEKRYSELYNKDKYMMKSLEEDIKSMKDTIDCLESERNKEQIRAEQAEHKLMILKEAFAILRGTKGE